MSATRHALPALAAAALVVLAAEPVRAAESFEGCTGEITTLPTVITTQGIWCLKADRSTPIGSGAAITIAANNVTVDCNHFKLGGLAAGPSTQTTGIRAEHRVNPTVRLCNVRGFRIGFEGIDLANALIEDTIFESNTAAGIHVTGGNSIIRRNVVSDIGGAVAEPTNAVYGIFAGGSFQVADNILGGIASDASGQWNVYGIFTIYGTGVVARNQVQDMVPMEASTFAGIYHSSSTRVVSRDNVVLMSGGMGIRCPNSLSVASGNTVLGADTGIAGCASTGDYVD